MKALAQMINSPALHWRCIGPPRGGRVVAVAGDVKRSAILGHRSDHIM
jgi:hypothetical protein